MLIFVFFKAVDFNNVAGYTATTGSNSASDSASNRCKISSVASKLGSIYSIVKVASMY